MAKPTDKTKTHLEFNPETWERAKLKALDLESTPTSILKILLKLWVDGEIRLTIEDTRPTK